MKRILWGLMLALGITSSVSAQDSWTVISGSQASALFEENVRGVSVSPDGMTLVGLVGDTICTLVLSTNAEQCYPLPDEFGGNLVERPEYNPIVWSPDSTQIAFTENLYMYMAESDLWVFDLTTGTFTNRTDDGAVGNFIRLEETALLDYLPAYAPNGDIYFFRSQRLEPNTTLTLQRLAADADTPEEVADLTFILPTLSIYYSPAISPDGTKMAVPVLATRPDIPESGLWIIDLTEGVATQITRSVDPVPGLPEHAQIPPAYASNPVWTADSSGIVFKSALVAAMSRGGLFPPHNFLYVDVASGDVEPLFDLSDFPEGAAAFREDANGVSPIASLPREGAVSADGTRFIYLSYDVDFDHPQLSMVSLPPDGSEPVLLADVDFEMAPFMPNTTMTAADQVLLGGWVYQLEPAQ